MIKKILVPLDGSELAARAISYAEELAVQFDAELLFIWVVHPLVETSDEAIGVYEGIRKAHHKEAKTYFKTAPLNLHKSAFQTTTKVLEGPVAETILDMAVEESVDLIVMSTHGRSGLERWVYGSVADKVLQHAPCPVFLVRATEDKKPKTVRHEYMAHVPV